MRGGRVDGHRGGDGVELDVSEEALHVLDGVDGDADLADFADGHGVVGVVADLGGEIEGDGEAGGAVREEEFVAAVGLLGIAHAGVLAHGPESAAVHGGLDAAGVGILAGVAQVAVGVEVGCCQVFRGPEGLVITWGFHCADLLPRREALMNEVTQK